MQLKASTDYGVRTILYLAAKGATCSSKDIAKDMAIPRDYLIQLAQLLRNAGLIEARPGKYGGYRLAKDPSEISLLQVISALEDNPQRTARVARTLTRNDALLQGIRQMYDLVEGSFDAYLGSLTIEVLLACSQDTGRAADILACRLAEEGRRLAAG